MKKKIKIKNIAAKKKKVYFLLLFNMKQKNIQIVTYNLKLYLIYYFNNITRLLIVYNLQKILNFFRTIHNYNNNLIYNNKQNKSKIMVIIFKNKNKIANKLILNQKNN